MPSYVGDISRWIRVQGQQSKAKMQQPTQKIKQKGQKAQLKW
jgi:hypothetical protein